MLDALEPRLLPSSPFSDFAGPIDTAVVVGGPVAYGAGTGGGPRVKVVAADGRTAFDQFVFEDSFRCGVRVGLADVDRDGDFDLAVGSMRGGGPRVRVFEATPTGYLPAADYFAFEGSFRGGVYVEGWGPTLAVFAGDGGGPVGVIDGVPRYYGPADARDSTGWTLEDTDGDGTPEVFRATAAGSAQYDAAGTPRGGGFPMLGGEYVPAPALAAHPHPAKPGNVALVNKYLAAVPDWLQRYLADTGMAVVVYDGAAVTALPEFAHLHGVPTPTEGDGDRTYDEVLEVGPVDWHTPAVVTPTSGNVVLHEVGHGLWLRLTAAAIADWGEVWRSGGWASEYERLNEGEAFAASLARWVRNVTGSPPEAAAFVADLRGRLAPAPAARG